MERQHCTIEYVYSQQCYAEKLKSILRYKHLELEKKEPIEKLKERV